MATDDEDALYDVGDQCSLWADYSGWGPRWWNVFILAAVASRVDDDDMVRLAIGSSPTETDKTAMLQQTTVRVGDMDQCVRPGWTLPADADPRGASTAHAPASPHNRQSPTADTTHGMHKAAPQTCRKSKAPASNVGAAQARRRTSYLSATQRRQSVAARAAARAAQSASQVILPAFRLHRIFLHTARVSIGTAIIWDLCSGPFKSMAMCGSSPCCGLCFGHGSR